MAVSTAVSRKPKPTRAGPQRNSVGAALEARPNGKVLKRLPAAGSQAGMPSATRSSAARAKAAQSAAVACARRTLGLEADGLAALAAMLGGEMAEPFAAAVDKLRQARGRVIVTGIGKSGHICQKVAATFASTGTPASFVHPSEASHGDLGMITRDDVILSISKSGETVELTSIITYSRRFAVPLISITSNAASALGKASDIALVLPKVKEACPHDLAPTTSTTMQLALGDALAMALLESRGFSATDFKVFHPGGSLGAQLKFVSDVMHKDERLPLVHESEPMADALVTMTQKSFGCLGIVDDRGRLSGIITDGDLRRHMGNKLLAARAADIMTVKPKTVRPGMLASAALELMNSSRITAVFAIDRGKPVGIVHVHDLLRTGVI